MRLRVGHQQSLFCPLLGSFISYNSPVSGPGLISTIDDPGVCLRVGRQHSQFWPILARFVNYYSRYWGPKAISMVVEPQGALTCQSSPNAVWADSVPLLGLLLCFGVLE